MPDLSYFLMKEISTQLLFDVMPLSCVPTEMLFFLILLFLRCGKDTNRRTAAAAGGKTDVAMARSGSYANCDPCKATFSTACSKLQML